MAWRVWKVGRQAGRHGRAAKEKKGKGGRKGSSALFVSSGAGRGPKTKGQFGSATAHGRIHHTPQLLSAVFGDSYPTVRGYSFGFMSHHRFLFLYGE